MGLWTKKQCLILIRSSCNDHSNWLWWRKTGGLFLVLQPCPCLYYKYKPDLISLNLQSSSFCFLYCVITEYVSPWYNHNSWLGIKHQVTYLLFCYVTQQCNWWERHIMCCIISAFLIPPLPRHDFCLKVCPLLQAQWWGNIVPHVWCIDKCSFNHLACM